MNTPSFHTSESFVTTNTIMRDVMTPAPTTIEASATVAAAQAMMRKRRCRHLPVVRHGKLVGIVSERDLYVLESLVNANSAIDFVGEAMTAHVYTTTPDAKLRDVARVMAAERYGSAVVVDGEKIVGIFTATDAFRHLVAALR
jgi:acetoin utilization protein AcuB